MSFHMYNADRSHHFEPALDRTVVSAILVVVVIFGLAVAMVIRLVRETRRWRRFRSILRDWLDEREKRESA